MTFIPLPRLGPCPVPPETVVRVQFRGSEGESSWTSRSTYRAEQLRWAKFKGQSEPLPGDIVGYEVAG